MLCAASGASPAAFPSRCSSPTAGPGSPLHTGSHRCLCGVPSGFWPTQANKLLIVPLRNTCAEIHKPSPLSAKIEFFVSDKSTPFKKNDCSRSQLEGIAAHRPARFGFRTNLIQTPQCSACGYQSKLSVPAADAVRTCCWHAANSDLAPARNVRSSLSRHLLCKLYEVGTVELQSEFDFFSLCACLASHPRFIYTQTRTKANVKKRRQSWRPAGRVALPGPARLGAAAPHPRPRSAPAPPGTAHGRARTRRARGDPGEGGQHRSPSGKRRQRGGPRAARHGTAPAGRGEVAAKSRCGGRRTPRQPPRPPAVSPHPRLPAAAPWPAATWCRAAGGAAERAPSAALPARSAPRSARRSAHAPPTRGRRGGGRHARIRAAAAPRVADRSAGRGRRRQRAARARSCRGPPAVLPSRLRAAPRGNGRAGRCGPWGRSQEAMD